MKKDSLGRFIPESKKTHGMSQTNLYFVWQAMKDRCLNPRHKNWHNYGGRGIKVCDRWMKFENFVNDMGERPPKHTLERKDNNAGYSPENCVWATQQEQCRNMRTTKFITANGIRKSLTEWAEMLGTWKTTITGRLKRGWSECDAVTTPIKKQE